MRRYLVAGGAGFIGSHLVERLVNEGHKVTVIDNLITGSLDNIRHMLDKVRFIEGDICDTHDVGEFDVIYHLASIANPSEYVTSPLETLSSGSFGTRTLLNIAKGCGARFYFFSSSEVYGHQGGGSASTEGRQSRIGLLNARSPYYIGKMFGEEYVKAFSEKHDIEYLIVRPFNIYGTRMDSSSDYGRVVTNFLRRSLDGRPLEVNGDGEQVRSFCHIDDLLRAILKIEGLPTLEHHVVNIGDPRPITINGLAKLVSSLSQGPCDIIHRETVENEPRYRIPDIGLIERWVGWRPEVPLEEGLRGVRDRMIRERS